MAGRNEVRIAVTADDRASGTFAKVRQNAGTLNTSITGLAKSYGAMTIGVGLAGVAIAKIGGTMIGLANLASDLEESQNKVNVVFGDSADVINDLASTAATALGQTEQAVLSAAGTVGNLFTAMGLTQQAAAGMSTEIVKLSTDIASFQNITTDEALLALRAGLVGEAEPMRRLGVLLSAATVQAKAFELGLAATTKELTEADKVQARYAIILEQTAIQQGDFARTSEGLANQQKILAAQFTEMKTSIGEGLVGPLTEATAVTIELVDWLTRLGDMSPLEIAVDVVGGISAGGLFQQFGTDAEQVAELNRQRSEAGLDAVPALLSGRFVSRVFQQSEDDALAAGPDFGALPERAVAKFLRLFEGPEIAQQARAMELVREQRERATEGLGRLSTAERALASERERVTANELFDLAAAYEAGGEERFVLVRQQQAAETAMWQEFREGLSQTLGEDVPETFRSAWETIVEINREGVDAVIAEEQRLADQRLSQQARNQAMLIRGFMANPAAGMNTPGLIDLINNPSLLPPGPAAIQAPSPSTKTLQLTVNIGDKRFVDEVDIALDTLEATGVR